MRILLRLIVLGLLLIALAMSRDSAPIAAQAESETEEEPLETFVPTEKLPADSAVSFPVDI